MFALNSPLSLALDSTGVYTGSELCLLKYPLIGGNQATLWCGLSDINGMVTDATNVYWITSDGALRSTSKTP